MISSRYNWKVAIDSGGLRNSLGAQEKWNDHLAALVHIRVLKYVLFILHYTSSDILCKPTGKAICRIYVCCLETDCLVAIVVFILTGVLIEPHTFCF